MRVVRVCYPCSSVEDALDYFESLGELVRVSLMRGDDGYLRGMAVIRIVNG